MDSRQTAGGRPAPVRGAALRAAIVFGATLALYLATAVHWHSLATPVNSYHDHLAEAFLNGRLYLAEPPGIHDLTQHQGRWYVPFPPLPAAMMLPWVARFGIAGTSTVVFSCIAGAASVALLSLLLDALAARGWIALRGGGRLWLCAVLAAGCVHWYVAVDGTVWHLAQAAALLFVMLAAWLAVAFRSPWPAAMALALAMWGRPNVVLTWPLLAGLAAEHLRDAVGAVDRRRWRRWCAASAVPLGASVAGWAAYNQARFGDPLDFGYTRQNVSMDVAGDLYEHGQFSLAFLKRNLQTMALGMPVIRGQNHWPQPDPRGMSLFLTSPVLLFALVARQPRPMVRGAWIAVGLSLVPLLLYYNTGWAQFGYRFSLDFMVPALVLLAAAFGPRISRLSVGLILVGVAVNLWGVWWWFTQRP